MNSVRKGPGWGGEQVGPQWAARKGGPQLQDAPRSPEVPPVCPQGLLTPGLEGPFAGLGPVFRANS